MKRKSKNKIRLKPFFILTALVLAGVFGMGGQCFFFQTGSNSPPAPNTGGIFPQPTSQVADNIKVAANSYYFQNNYYSNQPNIIMVTPYSDNTGDISKDAISYSFSSTRSDTIFPSFQTLSGGSHTFYVSFNSVENMSPTVDLTTTVVDPTSGVNVSITINPYLWFPSIYSTAEDDNSTIPGGSYSNGTLCTLNDLDSNSDFFVALPSSDVNYGTQIYVRTSSSDGNGIGYTLQATVWDCGPWFCDSVNCDPVGDGSGDEYWTLGVRPYAEYLNSNHIADGCLTKTGYPSNEGGIDLSQQVCLNLGNGFYQEDSSGSVTAIGPSNVDWRFASGSQNLTCY